MLDELNAAWWNVENLFDIDKAPSRPDWMQTRLRSELRGWNSDVLDAKLSQLSTVVRALFDGDGPDLLGVCEVENEAVLAKLAARIAADGGRYYQVAHADTGDKRGIDCAFLYDPSRLTVGYITAQVIQKRNATRDLLQVNFTLASDETLVCIANHWPSRLGGEAQSEPYRMMAGETLAYWMDRIPDYVGKDPLVLVMGDFNDEPFNRSLSEYALSTQVLKKVTSRRSRKPYLYNLMWPLMGSGLGTHYYNGQPGMLDQLLCSAELARRGGAQVKPETVDIFAPQWMWHNSRTVAPRRFNRPSSRGGVNRQGYSDHFPITVRIRLPASPAKTK